MPELPDLTIYARNLEKRILHRPIARVQVYQAAKVNVPEAALRDALVGQSFEAVQRDGKELVFALSNGQRLAVHLMLFGRFTLLPYLQAHTINGKTVLISFEDGEALAVSDIRGMARVTLNPKENKTPDALSEAFTWQYFQGVLQKKAGANIKALLIDQHVVKGIGNAYVDEILWKAEISPKSLAGGIPEEARRALYDAIDWVMRDAIEELTRLTPDSIAGEERSFLRVHNPKRKTDPAGHPIRCEEIAGKRTYYTDHQKLYL